MLEFRETEYGYTVFYNGEIIMECMSEDEIQGITEELVEQMISDGIIELLGHNDLEEFEDF